MHRVGMDQKARELTIHNAFTVLRPKLIAGRHVMLIDDVLTSGATASQAAKILKKNGAAGVSVFTLARAVLS
jgi:predicted amidophosphoribosyltransferase